MLYSDRWLKNFRVWLVSLISLTLWPDFIFEQILIGALRQVLTLGKPAHIIKEYPEYVL